MLFAERGHLGRAGEVRAVAQRHDVERLARRQHRPMARAGVVGMSVRDKRAVHRPDRIDEEIAGRAIKPFRAGMKQVAGAHRLNIGVRRVAGKGAPSLSCQH